MLHFSLLIQTLKVHQSTKEGSNQRGGFQKLLLANEPTSAVSEREREKSPLKALKKKKKKNLEEEKFPSVVSLPTCIPTLREPRGWRRTRWHSKAPTMIESYITPAIHNAFNSV